MSGDSKSSEVESVAVTSDPHPEQIKKPRASLRRFVPVLVLLFAALILFLITANWNSWVGGQSSQKTDDAQLRADITPLSTRVSGAVTEVCG